MSERLEPDEHRRRGNFRNDRHGDGQAFDRNGEPIDPRYRVTAADRRRILADLPAPARALAVAVLDKFWDFDPGAQVLLRAFALSAARLEALQMAAKPNPTALLAEIQNFVLLFDVLFRGPAEDR